MAAAFDAAANGAYNPPGLPQVGGAQTIPPSVLKAVGWVESGWRQFNSSGRPLVSPDFGYGVMQITSGMAGAFGNPTGDIDPTTQSAIASDYRYNIAYGARMLAQKRFIVPTIGSGDPSVIENWYYALWAYNGWGWVNNPNNPRFSRSGNAGSNPTAFPYQERVLYLVAHPPRDLDGNPLWPPVHVSLPSRKLIARTPVSYDPPTIHKQMTAGLDAVYQPAKLSRVAPGALKRVRVHLINTGLQPWLASGTSAVTLTYHLFTAKGDPWSGVSPFAKGVLAFGQRPVALPHDVLPGHTISVTATIQSPTKPGTYRVAWDLAQGANAWLSQLGVLPRVQTLHVGGTQSPPDPPSATATPVAARARGLEYVADTAAPDGTSIVKHQVFVKSWMVFNSGKGSWTSGFTLQQISGTGFGRKSIPIPPTRACSAVNLLTTMRAPRKPGVFSAAWRARAPDGTFFGDKLTVKIQVTSHAQGPPPGPTPTPTPKHPRRPTPTPTPVG